MREAALACTVIFTDCMPSTIASRIVMLPPFPTFTAWMTGDAMRSAPLNSVGTARRRCALRLRRIPPELLAQLAHLASRPFSGSLSHQSTVPRAASATWCCDAGLTSGCLASAPCAPAAIPSASVACVVTVSESMRV